MSELKNNIHSTTYSGTFLFSVWKNKAQNIDSIKWNKWKNTKN